jgi:hypothetical protein
VFARAVIMPPMDVLSAPRRLKGQTLRIADARQFDQLKPGAVAVAC